MSFQKIVARKAKCRCCHEDVPKGSTMWQMGGSTFGTYVDYHYCETCFEEATNEFIRARATKRRRANAEAKKEMSLIA